MKQVGVEIYSQDTFDDNDEFELEPGGDIKNLGTRVLTNHGFVLINQTKWK